MRRSALLLLLACACGQSQSPAPAPTPSAFVPPPCAAEPVPPCEDDGLFFCPESVGYGFVGALFDKDQTSTAAVSIPEPGSICMRGELAAPADHEVYAELILGVNQRGEDATCIRGVFDARAHGVTALSFELDAVPDTRVYFNADVIVRAECPEHPFGCVAGGRYTLFSPDREEAVLLRPGQNLAVFENFVGNDLSTPLDTTRLSLFSLRLIGINRALAYDFCLSHLALLDAAGREVQLSAP